MNPVAVLINKAMIEIPPKFVGCPPVNPESQWKNASKDWVGAQGLAEDIRYYGEWMKKKAFERIGYLYPNVVFQNEQGGGKGTVFTWIWARTLKCPNPACGCEMPLSTSFELCRRKGKEAYVQPLIKNNKITYSVEFGKNMPESPKIARGAKFKCLCCNEVTTPDYIKTEALEGRMGTVLMAIVAEGNNGRRYLSPCEEHIEAAKVDKPAEYPTGALSNDRRAIWCPLYGIDTFDKLFTARQLITLTTFSDLVQEAQTQIEHDGGLSEYSQAVSIYLTFVIDKLVDYNSTLCSWHMTRESIANALRRQALPMVWDFTEVNPFCNSAGSFSNMLSRVYTCVSNFHAKNPAYAVQQNATDDYNLRNIMISTDPPYYDNIGYADLSDYFYIWMRRALRKTYPNLLSTLLVPKADELIAAPYRFDGSRVKAKTFFEDGMLNACKQMYIYAHGDVPVTIYYAFKQSDSGDDSTSVSTGWETMLSAIIQSGFSITGTWPIRTELTTALKGNVNALASSIVLVCRKRPIDAPICTRRDFINLLKRELTSALHKLQASNIAPVDLAQSAIGPGISVFSRFLKVLDADGVSMGVRSALQIINQELDCYFAEQDGELDRDSRFCVDLYIQYAFSDVKFGAADVLARAKNTSVEKLVDLGVLYAQKGVTRLRTREELSEKVDSGEEMIWLLTQQLTRAMEKGGVVATAEILVDMFGSIVEHARALAYRLFTIAERKGWAQEAYAYNALVVAWPDVQAKAAELKTRRRNAKQVTLSEVIDKTKGNV